MKDSIIFSRNKVILNTIDSVRHDLKGIKYEIRELSKGSTQDKGGVSSNTKFTVSVTLTIFVLGIIINRLIILWDKSRKQKELRDFFEYHLKQVNDFLLPKLKAAYTDYAKNTTIDTGITSTPPKVLSSDFQRLIHTNFEELFKAYTEKKTLSKVLGNIELVDKVQIELSNFHDRVYEDSGDVRDDLEKRSEEYLSILDRYTKFERKNTANYKDSATYQLIFNSIKTYYTEIAGTRQLSRFYKEIIRAIQEHIVKNGEYETHEILKEVAEKGRQLSYIVSKLEGKTEEISNQYKIYAEDIERANTALNELIPNLK